MDHQVVAAFARRELGNDVSRVRAEFLELRGLALTPPQAARLFGLPMPACDQLLAGMVAEGFLRLTPAGRYVLNHERP